jgi:hypothetical protein
MESLKSPWWCRICAKLWSRTHLTTDPVTGTWKLQNLDHVNEYRVWIWKLIFVKICCHVSVNNRMLTCITTWLGRDTYRISSTECSQVRSTAALNSKIPAATDSKVYRFLLLGVLNSILPGALESSSQVRSTACSLECWASPFSGERHETHSRERGVDHCKDSRVDRNRESVVAGSMELWAWRTCNRAHLAPGSWSRVLLGARGTDIQSSIHIMYWKHWAVIVHVDENNITSTWRRILTKIGHHMLGINHINRIKLKTYFVWLPFVCCISSGK